MHPKISALVMREEKEKREWRIWNGEEGLGSESISGNTLQNQQEIRT